MWRRQTYVTYVTAMTRQSTLILMRQALGLITSVMLAAIVVAGVAAGQTTAPPADPTLIIEVTPSMPPVQPITDCSKPCTNYVLK